MARNHGGTESRRKARLTGSDGLPIERVEIGSQTQSGDLASRRPARRHQRALTFRREPARAWLREDIGWMAVAVVAGALSRDVVVAVALTLGTIVVLLAFDLLQVREISVQGSQLRWRTALRRGGSINLDQLYRIKSVGGGSVVVFRFRSKRLIAYAPDGLHAIGQLADRLAERNPAIQVQLPVGRPKRRTRWPRQWTTFREE